MKNEHSILDAVEYILIALDNISNYNEFIEYKEEIRKAILDIKNSIINITNNNSNQINSKELQFEESYSNLNSNKNIDNDSSSFLSSMLGLKFNYEPYFNEKNIRSLTQNEPPNLNNNSNLIKNNFINNSNDINNNNNISYYKSLRKNLKPYNIINTNYNNFDYNNNQIYNKNENINNDNKDIINNRKIKKRKNKINLITDIIMKINNEEYVYTILTKLYGEDLTDKLMSNNVDDDLLEAIQNSIKEIESLKQKNDFNNKNNKKINKTFNEDNEEKPKIFPLEKLMSTKHKNGLKKSNSTHKNNNKKNINVYKEFNFAKSLRKNGIKKNLKKNNEINTIEKEKPFINATSPYGNYFDAPLQKGGLSKLSACKQ